MNEALATVLQHVQTSGRFGAAKIEGATLRCEAKDAAGGAWYLVDRSGEGWAVSLLTSDRWLSESIEGDMLEGRDTAEELVDDELVEVTPKAIRLRKRYLDANERKRMSKTAAAS